jgi:hypothetical protein
MMGCLVEGIGLGWFGGVWRSLSSSFCIRGWLRVAGAGKALYCVIRAPVAGIDKA